MNLTLKKVQCLNVPDDFNQDPISVEGCGPVALWSVESVLNQGRRIFAENCPLGQKPSPGTGALVSAWLSRTSCRYTGGTARLMPDRPEDRGRFWRIVATNGSYSYRDLSLVLLARPRGRAACHAIIDRNQGR
ncbi:hypothetical protein RRG08_064866 [Elysia crispata]|uniref:Uncharacterized protein n=1 Tax=Elysia crispata TaxID=231223 RepID=A0AAE1AWM8_9GAST|nr:hypothetical protein RRG08_064866 [Elysia crispata]